MNLTKCFVAGLCISAMTASAGILQSDAFENNTYSGNWSGGLSLTLGGSVTNGDASLEGYTLARPMTGVTSNRVLQLNTEGSVWTNTVGASFAGTTNVFADMLVKFVPSEELPVIGTDVKLAVAVLAGTPNRLAISVIDQVNQGTNAWILTTGAMDTNVWYRLTVNLYCDVNQDAYAYVKTNGVLVNVAPYFVNQADKKLNSIGFSGTGFIDEVVVRTDDPFVTEIPLTLSFSTGVDSVYVGEIQKTTGQPVLSGASLIITASKWYEIANVAGTDVMTNWVAGAIGDSAATVTVTAAASGKTVTITPRTETSTAPQGGSTLFSGQQANKVAAWAIAKGVTTLLDANYPQYLFNIATNATVPTLSIKSVAISNTTATVSVQAGTTDFSPSAINGALKIKGYPTLGGTAEVYGTGFTGTTNAIFVQDIGTNKFIKAMVTGVPAPQ
ncbi:MAG: hypothetical protein WCP12_08760 [bacterium]